MVFAKSNRGRYASPALAAASYPFVDLPSGDTLRCKLFPADKYIKFQKEMESTLDIYRLFDIMKARKANFPLERRMT